MRAKPLVENLKSYSAPLEGRRDKLRLDFNENGLGPSPKVLAAIRQLPPEAYAIYPEYDGLTERYANHVGVPTRNVGLFNGVDAAIRAVFDAYGCQNELFLTTTPTFGYYGPCARLQGMQLLEVPYPADLRFPVEAFESALAARPRLVFICNPNNPTGTLVAVEQILTWAKTQPGSLFVIDELYADFTGVTALAEAATLSNLVVLRSLSKSFGLAALRVGFAIASAEIVDRLGRVTGPYDVNMFAVVAAQAALDDAAYTEGYIAEVKRAKAFTVAELQKRHLRFFADGGNYLLVWPKTDLEQTVIALDECGIRVRSSAGKPVIGGSFRLTIGTEAQMRTFFEVFDSCTAGAPQAG